MNLQTDNDMKRVLLFFSLMLLLGNIKGLAQSIVIDPAMIGTLVYSHQAQQVVLKVIQSEETKIRNFQILIHCLYILKARPLFQHTYIHC